MKIVFGFIIVFFLGCTSIKVNPLQYDAQLREVSLIDNPSVKIIDFVPVMEKHFARRGIGLKRVPDIAQLKENEYGIRYSALRSWDFYPYLCDAYVNVYRGNLMVANGVYHLRLRGGFSLLKWMGTESKLEPMYDELLKNYPVIETIK